MPARSGSRPVGSDPGVDSVVEVTGLMHQEEEPISEVASRAVGRFNEAQLILIEISQQLSEVHFVLCGPLYPVFVRNDSDHNAIMHPQRDKGADPLDPIANFEFSHPSNPRLLHTLFHISVFLLYKSPVSY